jgi:lysophospholipid acyltransferase (LPLAT)-like uncharacterized protein
VRLGKYLLSFIGLTSKITYDIHPQTDAFFRERRPIIYTFWHRYQLLLCYDRRGRGINVLVSQSKDGELIARVLLMFGFKCVRGSSSRGGVAALLKMIELLRSGDWGAFTPDGPRGPFRSVQPGVVAAAQKSGAPIIPIGWAGTKVKTLNTWDKFLIPLPFGRYHIVYGEPLYLAPGDKQADEKVRAALDAAAARAEAGLSAGR